MNHKVFYFTGTGNSLWAARLLSRELGSAEPVPIISPGSFDGINELDSVGIVFPVYMHRMPHIVAETLRRLPKAGYLYAVAVNGGDPGKVFRFFRKQIRPTGNILNAGFSILTPGNYLPMGEAIQGEALDDQLQRGAEKVSRLAGIVKRAEAYFDEEGSWFRRNISPGLFYSLGYKYIAKLDSSFSVDDSCTSCGTCQQVCPVNNVRLTDGKPVWHQNCQLCMACLNLCPEGVIQFADKTRGLRRYRNPFVAAADIAAQKGV